MFSSYERRLLMSYLSNLSSECGYDSPNAQAVVAWITENSDVLDLENEIRELMEADKLSNDDGEATDLEPAARARQIGAPNRRVRVMRNLRRYEEPELSDKGWMQFNELLEYELARTRKVRLDPMAKSVRQLAEIVQLSKTDIAIIELLLRYQTRPLFETLFDLLSTKRRARFHGISLHDRTIAAMLGVSQNTVYGRLNPDFPLVRSGLVELDNDGDLQVLDRLRRLSFPNAARSQDIRKVLFDTASSGELEWSDFDHVAEARDHVERLIRGALKNNAPGVNVLIYGPPGTGKTEFCKTLAARLGVTLHSVGESDDGKEPTRGGRLRELHLAQNIFGNSDDTLLLFDEMEDLLADPMGMGLPFFLGPKPQRRGESVGSKVYMNRLLEQNTVPTLWTSNSARYTNVAILRRMMYALELRQPSSKVRARIWTRQLDRHGIESNEADASSLARDYNVNPGVAAGATAAAKLVDNGDVAFVREGTQSLSRLLHGERPPQRKPAEFDPVLINTKFDIEELANQLAPRSAQRVSLCLSGPPGTGKSATVRYLAERMGLVVEQKRASDLMSKWVGETEQLIARAFKEAREEKLFLVFDEADSLLSSRKNARTSWEVSQVNEMLTWMESHPLPFACTTNFSDHLDEATLRRFDFKIELDYMTADQARVAFNRFFKLDPPAELNKLTGLTPGDFAVVRRRAEILGELDNASALVNLLREECDFKPTSTKQIGFSS